MEYIRMQSIARKTMNYIREIIRPGMSLPEVRRLCEEKMLELGAEKFWYYGIGAFVFSGEDTGISVSGRNYQTPDRIIQPNDLVTIDLSPERNQVWGDYARTIVIENGTPILLTSEIHNREWKNGLLMENNLHRRLQEIYDPHMTFEELYFQINDYIRECGFCNLDFNGNLGHSIEKHKEARIYIERGNKHRMSEVLMFTFEPHIGIPGSPYGYKKEDIYHYEQERLRPL